jgi:hypothetical protein
MSVISQPESVPNRIGVVVRYLQGRAPVGDDELVGALSPESLRSGAPQMLRSILGDMQQLGLVVSEDDRWELAEDLKNEAALLSYFEGAVLDADRVEENGQRFVPRALAWFLTQDPAHPLPAGENWRTKVIAECPAASDHVFELINDTRQRQLAYWAVYLGYAWRLPSGDADLLVPDPSAALERLLRALLTPNTPMAAPAFFDRVAEQSPVFEGGTIREEVEGMLIPRRQRPVGQLSRSTSFALARLEQRGVLTLPRPSADATPLTLDLWPERRAITHLALTGGA